MIHFGTWIFLQHVLIKVLGLCLMGLGFIGLFLPIIPGLFFLVCGTSLLGLHHGHKWFWPNKKTF
jgi:uncharacterized protein YqgC (DUF456 family)